MKFTLCQGLLALGSGEGCKMNNQQLSAGGSHVLACGECSGSPHAAPTRIKWDETSSCGHGEPSTTGTWASQVAAFPSDADPGQGPASGLHGPTGSLFDPPFGGVPAFLFGLESQEALPLATRMET